jgi:hypothetical protein
MPGEDHDTTRKNENSDGCSPKEHFSLFRSSHCRSLSKLSGSTGIFDSGSCGWTLSEQEPSRLFADYFGGRIGGRTAMRGLGHENEGNL